MVTTGKILVTGCRGQLGRDLVNVLADQHQVVGVDIEDFDICEQHLVSGFVRSCNPDVVVHAAAYTDVDGCEANRDLALSVNGKGARNIASACREVGAYMVYFSTDYVFDGQKSSAYVEEDGPNPATVYGQSKLAGEEAVREVLEDYAILRIAWVYGRHGHNFVKTMLRTGHDQVVARDSGAATHALRVVDDQFGNPTWTVDVARQTAKAISERIAGLFHATSEGETSWYQFARDIFSASGMSVDVVPCATEDYARPAPRPKRSSLENSRLKAAGLNLMRDYRAGLEEFVRTCGFMLVS